MFRLSAFIFALLILPTLSQAQEARLYAGFAVAKTNDVLVCDQDAANCSGIKLADGAVQVNAITGGNGEVFVAASVLDDYDRGHGHLYRCEEDLSSCELMYQSAAQNSGARAYTVMRSLLHVDETVYAGMQLGQVVRCTDQAPFDCAIMEHPVHKIGDGWNGAVNALVYAEDQLYVGQESGLVQVCDPDGGEPCWELAKWDERAIHDMTVGGGRLFITLGESEPDCEAGCDDALHVCPLDNGDCGTIGKLHHSSRHLGDLAYTDASNVPDAPVVFVAQSDGYDYRSNVYRCKLENTHHACTKVFDQHNATVISSMVFSPDLGLYLAMDMGESVMDAYRAEVFRCLPDAKPNYCQRYQLIPGEEAYEEVGVTELYLAE